MIIKYYNLRGDVSLISDVEDVSAINVYDGKLGDDEHYNEYMLDHPAEIQGKEAKVIEYAKDGACRLFVFGTAYICSNEGKTLHTVQVAQKIV